MTAEKIKAAPTDLLRSRLYDLLCIAIPDSDLRRDEKKAIRKELANRKFKAALDRKDRP